MTALTKRSWIGVLALSAGVVLAIAASATVLVYEQTQLMDANTKTRALTREMQAFDELVQLRAETQQLEATRGVAAAGAIDWDFYLASFRGAVPAGATLSSISVDSATAFSSITAPSVPLQGPRVAQITVRIESTSADAVTVWLDNISTLPGFADATPTSVSNVPAGFASLVTVHLDAAALTVPKEPTP
ncbi:hypothetical protein [Plantibacter flavus]|uniref:hypothetical protein n=1 Tax=Plantibacter flavus TaxID=150123 RepID=UPI00117F4C90|nr:hypothetical protein [Plantibacter flavus]